MSPDPGDLRARSYGTTQTFITALAGSQTLQTATLSLSKHSPTVTTIIVLPS